MRLLSTVFFFLLGMQAIAKDYRPNDYVWTTESRNSSESMPCGGHDIGLNVWVENGDVLFYLSRSGAFDENNTLLKAGRFRLSFKGGAAGKFEQRLCLYDGSVSIVINGVRVRLWADVFSPVVFATIEAGSRVDATLSYESWRYKDRELTKAECQQCSYKWVLPKGTVTSADAIEAKAHSITFAHHNPERTVFDFTVERERLQEVKDSLYNPIGLLSSGGVMTAPGFTFAGTAMGKYASTDYKAWQYEARGIRKSTIRIDMFDYQRASMSEPIDIKRWAANGVTAKESAKRSAQWWNQYWQRSYIVAAKGSLDGANSDGQKDPVARMARNCELFRYMLGCNAYGQWPSKFNGSLFTFDPEYVDPKRPFTPDYRCWGGGTMTAQNQRLVYWPMLKSGDIDMMKAQLDTYLRMLPSAVARTRHYWGHGGASFAEQIENFGLPNPAEYGKHKPGDDPGMERNAWLEYQWDTVLEFCAMIFQMHQYAGVDISRYMPLITESLTFFDQHYRYLAKRRGVKELNQQGKLVLFPSSGCETFKMAYNPSSVVAALHTVATMAGDTLLLNKLPEIPLCEIGGKQAIAPAVVWERVQNVESPQLYPVFPWRVYGVGRPNIDIAINTYLNDPHCLEMRSTQGWKQDNIWAACLGLVDEAAKLNVEKFDDGPYRFPAFWEQGFDWAPDCNRGGAAMIGLQEMLLQEEPDGDLLPFAAWPKEWNVRYRLHATGGRIIEGQMIDGQTKCDIK